MVIQRLQTVIAGETWESSDFNPIIASEVKQSSDFNPVIAGEAMISKGLWRKNPENQPFQRVSGLFDARIDDAAG